MDKFALCSCLLYTHHTWETRLEAGPILDRGLQMIVTFHRNRTATGMLGMSQTGATPSVGIHGIVYSLRENLHQY